MTSVHCPLHPGGAAITRCALSGATGSYYFDCTLQEFHCPPPPSGRLCGGAMQELQWPLPFSNVACALAWTHHALMDPSMWWRKN